MSTPTLLTTTSTFNVDENQALQRLIAQGFRVVSNPHRRRLTEAEVGAFFETETPIGVVAGVEPLTAAVMERAPELRVLSRCGTGLGNVDLLAAKERGISVLNTPDAPSPAVAELTIGMMLAILRSIPQSDAGLRRGEWTQVKGGMLGARTVGIVGLGRIGRRVATLAAAFGAEVIACDPYAEDASVPLVSRDELWARSDIVTLHVDDGPETHHIIDAKTLAAMKSDAVLVNTSRGGLVDEEALVAALREERIGGAALDVYEEEPYSGPLTRLNNVVLTCHMGAAARETRSVMEAEAAENLEQTLIDLGLAKDTR